MEDNKILWQIFGEGIEELWSFPNDVTDTQIRDAYRDYQNSEYESFDEYIDEFNPQLGGERVFINEIWL